MTNLTQEKLKELFDYQNGNLIWRKHGHKKRVGSVAGCIDSRGYRVVVVDGIQYKTHRLIWMFFYGEFPKQVMDHINGDRADNRIENLREATSQENTLNTRKHKDNFSGYKGVTFNKRAARWMARAMLKGKSKFIGYFQTPEAAAAAYQDFAKIHHGEFYKGESNAS